MRLLALLTILLSLLSEAAASPKSVTVRTADGRTHQGFVDTRTDEASLWLRQDKPNVSLAFSVGWSSIIAAKIGDQSIDADRLDEAVQELLTERPAINVLLGPVEVDSQERQPTAHGRKTATLHVVAQIANWDADLHADGVEIAITPTDQRGHCVTARGNLSVRLLGEQRTCRHRSRFGELQRWYERVEPSHFGHDGSAYYRLPFRGLEPERDWTVEAPAVVNATLGVYGEGRFQATTPVPLRPFNPLGDRLQQRTGYRRFRYERGVAGRTTNGIYDSLPLSVD